MNMNEWAKEIPKNAVEHGWWDEERSFPEVVALCHSELSEALEEARAGRAMAYVVKIDGPDELCPYAETNPENFLRYEKPEGIAVELIDCIIRILDYLGKEGVDVEKLLRIKHRIGELDIYAKLGEKSVKGIYRAAVKIRRCKYRAAL